MNERIAQLESALMAQAEDQAREIRLNAQRRHKHILTEARMQLEEREALEKAAAETLGQRVYRQALQAHAVGLERDAQQLRWELVEDILDQVWSRLDALARDEEPYLKLLADFVRHAASLIDDPELVIEVNPKDHARLAASWDAFARAAGDKRATLAPVPIDARGGLVVRNPGNRVRVDQRFEARVERLRERLHQVILKQLLPQ